MTMLVVVAAQRSDVAEEIDEQLARLVVVRAEAGIDVDQGREGDHVHLAAG